MAQSMSRPDDQNGHPFVAGMHLSQLLSCYQVLHFDQHLYPPRFSGLWEPPSLASPQLKSHPTSFLSHLSVCRRSWDCSNMNLDRPITGSCYDTGLLIWRFINSKQFRSRYGEEDRFTQVCMSSHEAQRAVQHRKQSHKKVWRPSLESLDLQPTGSTRFQSSRSRLGWR